MTLATLHARFLQHCAVEKRLRPMTIKYLPERLRLVPAVPPPSLSNPLPSGERAGIAEWTLTTLARVPVP